MRFHLIGYDVEMANRAPMVAGEWYHCFNRGVDRRIVFESEDDSERFLALLYACNDEDATIRLFELEQRHVRFESIIKRGRERGAPLVDIAAYALMPNHVHLMLRANSDTGISKFLQKVFTGYTMYFNKKFERSGPLFAGAFKSKHITTDEYFKHAIQYVLLNPIELIQPRWKQGEGDIQRIEKFLRTYRYASVPDFFDIKRAENLIVRDIRQEYFDRKPLLRNMLTDARAYYRENAKFLER